VTTSSLRSDLDPTCLAAAHATATVAGALVAFVHRQLGVAAEDVDLDQPVFGVPKAAIGHRQLDSMELVELVMELEHELEASLLKEFADFESLSIRSIAAVVCRTSPQDALTRFVEVMS
jgi:acyl carrier protein